MQPLKNPISHKTEKLYSIKFHSGIGPNTKKSFPTFENVVSKTLHSQHKILISFNKGKAFLVTMLLTLFLSFSSNVLCSIKLWL